MNINKFRAGKECLHSVRYNGIPPEEIIRGYEM